MEQIMNMSYTEFSIRLINNELPKIKLLPLPKIIRETTGMYTSYTEWAYNNRELLKYVEPCYLYSLSPFALQK
jgi:hypothetical protein